MTKNGNNAARTRARSRQEREGGSYNQAVRSVSPGGRLVGGNLRGELDADSIVALVALNNTVGLPMLDNHRICLRDHGYRQQVWPNTAGLCTDRHRHIHAVSPIVARFTLPNAAAVPRHPNRRHPINKRLAKIRKLLAAPEMLEMWPGPCDLFVLGDPVPLDLPLGYDGTGGMRGVQHRRLGDLQTATVLKGLQRPARS
ncbi:hypothetical protein [Nocardia cyriacigeorgica]|uniref:hypothetical protein n=1 Tax=Nocardia cyriacigeorgica TaxID=135487 RepID=UPI00189402F4|nr:hypothetical protein [Nocardia cyriacigeorgica]MBF6289898.1 hypothetical protein [Nocardia cyriacigeorgica]